MDQQTKQDFKILNAALQYAAPEVKDALNRVKATVEKGGSGKGSFVGQQGVVRAAEFILKVANGEIDPENPPRWYSPSRTIKGQGEPQQAAEGQPPAPAKKLTGAAAASAAKKAAKEGGQVTGGTVTEVKKDDATKSKGAPVSDPEWEGQVNRVEPKGETGGGGSAEGGGLSDQEAAALAQRAKSKSRSAAK